MSSKGIIYYYCDRCGQDMRPIYTVNDEVQNNICDYCGKVHDVHSGNSHVWAQTPYSTLTVGEMVVNHKAELLEAYNKSKEDPKPENKCPHCGKEI